MNIPHKRSLLSLIIMSTFTATAFSAEETVELNNIEVIGTTPLHGVGLPADQIAANVQSVTAADMESSQSLDITDFMNKTLGSVSINSAQNNPFQPDLQFRGFSASPLVGVAQGLSVYQDGVRINEPFGDSVNFELIPQSAIASMNLMPGSNPLFGLNTLGGAISIQTKNGFTHEGHSLEGYGGSFGRKVATLESGANNGTFGYFVTAAHTEEEGWRDRSPSDIDQFFSNLSYRNEVSTLDLTLASVDSDMNGNGASPIELIATDREAVFTHPDNTINDMQMATLNGSHWFSDNVLLSGNTYFRKSDRDTFNGDGAELEVVEEDDGTETGVGTGAFFLFEEDDVFNGGASDDLGENGNGIELASVIGIAPADYANIALNNSSKTKQDSAGLSGQVTLLNDMMGKENQLIIGASYDISDVKYKSQSEVATFTNDRGTIGTSYVIDETVVDGRVDSKTYSLFATNTISMTDKLGLTLSGRYNRTEIDISGTSGNGATNLNATGETHVFSRFNPSVGMTYAVSDALGLYSSYSESSRAPTPSELTCADPEHPCALPNSFLADPPLEKVVSKTVEAGVRGNFANMDWSAGAYFTQNTDDIIFNPAAEGVASSGRIALGNFGNIDKTQRQGLEFSVAGKKSTVDWYANYSYIDATYETDNLRLLQGDSGAEVLVSKGSNLPGIPKHNVKLGADFSVTSKFTLGADASYHSGQYYRGDDANLDAEIGGYTVVNLHSRYKVNKNIEVFAKVDNLFDNEYSNFGLYGEPAEAPGLGGLSDEHFQGAGAPRAGWIGVKLSM